MRSLSSEPLAASWRALDDDERKPAIKVWLRRAVNEALHRPPERLRSDVPVTSMGLDSLGAAELARRIEADAGVALPLERLLDGPTLHELADRLLDALEAPEAGSAGNEPSARRIAAHGPAEAPASPGQRALRVVHELVPEGGAYHMAAAARVADLDLAALERAVRSLVARHGSLRTTFHGTPDGPVQRVASVGSGDEGTVGWTVVDATGEADAALRDRLATETARPFDLERGPLLRVTVYSRAGEVPVVLLVVHHVISDFRSMAVLARDLATLYAAETSGTTPSLPPLPITFADWSEHRRRRLEGPRAEELWSYWREALDGAPPELPLPTDRPRSAVQRQRGSTVSRGAGRSTAETVRESARRRGTTPFVVLLAAFQAWLSRLTHRRDLLVGSPAMGRTEPETADLIGYFVNPVVLRARRLDGDFDGLVTEAARRVREALAHQDFPFPWLAERWSPERDAARSPVFQVVFQLQQAEPDELAAFALRQPGVRVSLPGLELESMAFPERSTPFDLVLRTAFLRDQLVLSFQYDRDLFDATTIQRWLRSFDVFLEAVLESPTRRIAELPLATAAERHHVLHEWNDRVVAPQDARPPVLRVLDGPCRRAPDRIAVAAGDRHLTYGDLARRTRRIAEVLQDAGIAPETPVVLDLEPSPEWVVAAVGVQLAGGSYLPLDPQSPPERNREMVEDAGAVPLPSIGSEPPGPPDAPDNVERAFDPERLAYVIYTSGSSGRPKGVEVSHRALGNLVDWHLDAFGLTTDDRATQVAGLSFDASVWELWPVLTRGARLEIVPPEIRRSPLDLPAWLVERGITVTFLPTPLAEVVLARPWPSGGALRLLLTGGDALRRRPPEDAGFRLINNYGPTENAVVATSGAVASGEVSGPPSLGRPLLNVELYLVDRELRPVPMGAVGELVLGGRSLARGYRCRPARTAGSFVPHHLAAEPGSRLYRTGDLARFRVDGEIDFLGRGDRQVKIRGFRIELGEVEAALVAQRGVEEAVAVVRRVSGGPRLLAYVKAPELGSPGEDVGGIMEAGLSERLPVWMRPVAVLVLDALPHTAAGKVDRRKLAAEGPEPERPSLAGAYRPPSSPWEQRIAKAWRRVLSLDRVGADDNFFDLGGHSLLLPELQLALETELDRRVPLVQLLQHPTVAALARSLEPAGEETEEGVRRDDGGDLRRRADKQREQAARFRRAREGSR